MTEHERDHSKDPEHGWSTIGNSGGAPGDQLPDERIRQDVCDRLMQFGPEDCTTIDVAVNDGVVMLGGVLADRAAVALAEEVARSVLGVRDVNNRLRSA